MDRQTELNKMESRKKHILIPKKVLPAGKFQLFTMSNR